MKYCNYYLICKVTKGWWSGQNVMFINKICFDEFF